MMIVAYVSSHFWIKVVASVDTPVESIRFRYFSNIYFFSLVILFVLPFSSFIRISNEYRLENISHFDRIKKNLTNQTNFPTQFPRRFERLLIQLWWLLNVQIEVKRDIKFSNVSKRLRGEMALKFPLCDVWLIEADWGRCNSNATSRRPDGRSQR